VGAVLVVMIAGETAPRRSKLAEPGHIDAESVSFFLPSGARALCHCWRDEMVHIVESNRKE
jgi:hypothetical protein